MKKEIDRLKKRVEDQQELLRQDRQRKKKKPNERMDEQKPDHLDTYPFWCDSCQEDFKSPCYKTKHRLFGDIIAVYRAKCPICEEDCIRHVTHKDEDPYYQRSTKIRRQRNQYAFEMLQPKDFGFKTHYGDPYPGFTGLMQEKEERMIKEQLDQGLKRYV